VSQQDKPRYAMKMVIGDEEREISFEELALSNNLSQQALVSLLVKNKVIDGKELMDEIARIRKEQYRNAEQK